jgi:hypothetical protein
VDTGDHLRVGVPQLLLTGREVAKVAGLSEKFLSTVPALDGVKAVNVF